MEARIFGKELTNIIGQNLNNKNNHQLSQNTCLQLVRACTQKQDHYDDLNQNIDTLLVDQNNPQLNADYFMENLRFLRSQQQKNIKNSNYNIQESKISGEDRTKLIDWIAKVHLKYKMLPQTLFTVVSLIDQYLKIKETSLRNLQLVGVAAFFIASKYQQIYNVPSLKNLVSCCAFQYSAKDILNQEALIVEALEFKLIINSSLKFLNLYLILIPLGQKNTHLANYILQLSLLHSRFLKYPPSLLASSVIYLIKKIRKTESAWTRAMTELVCYEEKEMKACAKDLCFLLQSNCNEGKAIKQKYSQPCFLEVTRIKLERIEKK